MADVEPEERIKIDKLIKSVEGGPNPKLEMWLKGKETLLKGGVEAAVKLLGRVLFL